jgi:branched-chain amino acid transport system permease protein
MSEALQTPSSWKSTFRFGVIGGVVAVFLALVGMVEAFNQRVIIDGFIGFGPVLILLTYYMTGHFAVRQVKASPLVPTALHGALAGIISAALVVLYSLLFTILPAIGTMFVSSTPKLLDILTFGQGIVVGSVIELALGLALGALAALVQFLPNLLRRSLTTAVLWLIIIGLLTELIRITSQNYEFLQPLLNFLFAANGLSVPGALVLFVFVFGLNALWMLRGDRIRTRWTTLPPAPKRTATWIVTIAAFILLLALPQLLGLFFSDVLLTVGLYVLMGLGLNIVVGFAGLLDLGYVAFYAIGAYTLGVLTSPEVPFQLNMAFWSALPIALAGVVFAGIILGIPVLKIRGDYLAIVTLGFGEIIRLLANSDLLKPWLGDGLGLHGIPKPVLGTSELVGPQQIYYLALAGCLLVLFVATRLKNSRLGRAWVAIREDESVAEAMGINLVTTKLLAFAMGAAFAGIAGTIFATKLTTIYPVSFSILISINVLALIIIGGMGSIPGVVVGALALVGLPELLREFADYRLLIYGAVLVLMMLTRPEGLLPEKARQRELHEAQEEEKVSGIAAADEEAMRAT